MRQLALFVIPSAVAFVALGDVLTTILFRTGKFQQYEGYYVWGLLAASAVGLMASTQGRLLGTAFYAMGNTTTPLKCSLVRVAISALGAWGLAMPLSQWLSLGPVATTAGIPLASSVAAIVEFLLLRRALHRQLAYERLSARYVWQLALSAAGGALPAVAFFYATADGRLPGWIAAAIALSIYGGLYFTLTLLFGVDESRLVWARVRGNCRRSFLQGCLRD